MLDAYQLSNIKFSYAEKLALSIPELTIQASKITALIGPNGCGKSTLLGLLAFLHKNQQGQINFFSQPVSSQNNFCFIKRISYVPQIPYLLRGTVLDNLNLTLKFHNIYNNRSTQIYSVLEQFKISHLSQQQANTLSAGELQKVALTRAIITNPDVLLMDEPFSYLDPGSEQILEQFIHYFVKENNKTLMFSSHNRLQGLSIADNIISLVNGKSVNTPLINLFHGSIKNQLFDTGKIKIMLKDIEQNYRHVSIDPQEIVLSREPLISSMRNQYQGQVTAIVNEMGKIRITLLARELFHVFITPQAFNELDISLGESLWVNFKSHSVLAF